MGGKEIMRDVITIDLGGAGGPGDRCLTGSRGGDGAHARRGGCEQRVAPPFDLAHEDYQGMIDLNLHGVVNTCRAAVPGLWDRRWGRVVNIATVALDTPAPRFAAYAASKGAMVALSRNLALELGPDGVTVNVVAPGWIATPRAASAPREDLERLIVTTPLGYQGRPEHIAGAVLFYASPLADFVSGTYLPVSGGHDL